MMSVNWIVIVLSFNLDGSDLMMYIDDIILSVTANIILRKIKTNQNHLPSLLSTVFGKICNEIRS